MDHRKPSGPRFSTQTQKALGLTKAEAATAAMLITSPVILGDKIDMKKATEASNTDLLANSGERR